MRNMTLECIGSGALILTGRGSLRFLSYIDGEHQWRLRDAKTQAQWGVSTVGTPVPGGPYYIRTGVLAHQGAGNYRG